MLPDFWVLFKVQLIKTGLAAICTKLTLADNYCDILKTIEKQVIIIKKHSESTLSIDRADF
jgi:hypothetical protein